MKLSFKKRIALYNTMVVAITTAIVFVVIYAVVSFSSYQHLDDDISLEKADVLNALECSGDTIIINKMPEWEEAEHLKVEVNPTFIQIVDTKDRLIFKSANLQTNHFLFDPTNQQGTFYNTQISNKRLRIGQFPIRNDAEHIIGHLTIGISQQESYYVLNNLLLTLCISFPILLLILYSVIYLAASKTIEPVHDLIRAASHINDSNINTRLPLPAHEDEIFQLARTINDLLGRIENSIQQQKQFTADASHEIRTPLSAIRGILEILLRKQREPEHYQTKIKEVIGQTDRLNQLLDQLLQLARLESSTVKKETVDLNKLIEETIIKWDKQLSEKNIDVHISIPEQTTVWADHFFLSIIIDNLFSNAIKYGLENGQIDCIWDEKSKIFSISNKGLTISQEQMPLLFNRFYRTDDSRSSQISGNGLGLAIVKKLSDLQQIGISAQSEADKTTFSLQFPF